MNRIHLLVAIVVAGAILRLNHIEQPFTDYIDWRQASTAMIAENFYNRNWNIFYPEVNWNGPGPSYQGREFQIVSYSAALLYTVFGEHDWVGRSIAVLFGLWGIIALYLLIRRVWDEKHAIAGAAAMALLPGSIFVERSFIPDPAMVSLVVTSFLLLVVYLQTERLRFLLFAGVIGMLGFLTKITGLIIGLPMAYSMAAILGPQKLLRRKTVAALSIFAIIALIPVIAYYLWAWYLSWTYPPYHFAGAGNWIWDAGLSAWWEQEYFLPKLYWNLDRWIWTKPVFALVIIGFFCLPPRWAERYGPDQKRQGNFSKTPWLFHWWMLAGVIYYLIGAKELVINSWNLHIINPAAAAIAGHAIITIASKVKRIVRSPASSLAIAAILIIVLWVGQNHLRKMYYPPWDSLTNYQLGLALRRISAPEDLVITIPAGTTEPVAIYYSRRRGWSFPPPWPGVGWWGEKIADEKEAIRLFEQLRIQGANWLGIVESRKEKLWKNNPLFIGHVDRTCELRQESPVGVIYRIRSPEEMDKYMPQF